MTCLSDIDLATLHQHRLEERFSYKLAWSGTAHQQTQYNDLLVRHNASLKRQRIIQHKANQATSTKQREQGEATTNTASNQDSQLTKSEDEHDDGYFDSSTRRRRSGTWP